MSPIELSPFVRALRKAPLLVPGASSRVSLGAAEIQRLLPHRAPFLFVDRIAAVDLDEGAVEGSFCVRGDGPWFAGHFPNDPVFPGVLTVEAIGQLALTLLHFTAAKTTAVGHAVAPPRVRATHIHHATFLRAIRPNDDVTLYAKVLASDLTVVAGGQAYVNGELCATAISEVYVDE